jgi:hypothetical protein
MTWVLTPFRLITEVAPMTNELFPDRLSNHSQSESAIGNESNTHTMNIYNVTAEWSVDGNTHNTSIVETDFGSALESYRRWVKIICEIIAIPSDKAEGSVALTEGVDVFFKFNMSVE